MKSQERARWEHELTELEASSAVIWESKYPGELGLASTEGRTRAEITSLLTSIVVLFAYTALCSRKKHVISRTGWGWTIKMLFLVSCLLGVEGADLYFTGVLETWWWGSVSLPLGGFFIVTVLSSYKGSFYSEPESCLVYCYVCRQEETRCVASEQTLAAL